MEKAKMIYNGNVNLEKLQVFDESPMQKIIMESVKAIQDKKEGIISEALKIHVKEPIDLMKEIKRMFPRIKCISTHENAELWYWDNGTPEGQLLVTFYQGEMFKGIEPYDSGNRLSFKTGIEYTIAPLTNQSPLQG